MFSPFFFFAFISKVKAETAMARGNNTDFLSVSFHFKVLTLNSKITFASISEREEIKLTLLYLMLMIKSKLILKKKNYNEGFPNDSDDKESACNVGDWASIPGLGRSLGEGNGYPLQYSCLENSMDRGACRATVHVISE